MSTPASLNMGIGDPGAADDFDRGNIRLSSSRRTVEGPKGVQRLQPKVMLVLLCLARANGKVVTRNTLFDACWPGGGVGDDSLNRALKALREALRLAGSTGIVIETVPRTGYRLVVSDRTESQGARRGRLVQDAVDCWRMGLPQPDMDTVTALDDLLQSEGGSAREWGVLALLLRKAIEYVEARDCAKLVSRCEHAAREAHRLDPREANADVAIAGLKPLFGHWTTVRPALLDVLDREPAHPAALHDLAMLEMASGRTSAAAPIIDRLLAGDGLAASYHYKRMYHLWTLGDLEGAEQLAGRALALWPQHPAIWMARFWTLVFTGRAGEAERMAADEECTGFLPAPLVNILRATAAHKGRNVSVEDSGSGLVSAARSFAANGPAQAVAALLALCALDAVDDAFEVAFGYYLGRGSATAPLRWNSGDPCITDQHRRVSQPLFIPATRDLRRDPRFGTLCEDIGLRDYWGRFGISPDFLDEDSRTASPAARM